MIKLIRMMRRRYLKSIKRIKFEIYLKRLPRTYKRWLHNLTITKIVKETSHNKILELIWTICPALILLYISIPSMELLYYIENPLGINNFEDVEFFYKVIGHQWYWSYEYQLSLVLTDVNKIYINDFIIDNFYNNILISFYDKVYSFDSYILSEEDVLNVKGFRLLEVDNPLILKSDVILNFLITSVDVLHAWSVPSLGIKIDAVPGRLSLVSSVIKFSGIYYGQCSEICGVNHGFMPIKLIVK